ncbi:MAG: hypothetical protein HC828_20245 [Blastochloris sp.]|nr:hypothetical protein [Blastochloris sp.]
MRFGSLEDEDGRERELSQSSFSSFLNMRDPGVRAALQQARPRIETLQRRLKGLSQTFTLFRVWPHGGLNEAAVERAEAAEGKVEKR